MAAPAKVYFGSVRMEKAEAQASLPAKLQRILAKFDLPQICQSDRVPIKMHLGGSLGHTTIHPLLVRMVVQAIKAAGGQPFIIDGLFDSVLQAASRGYTSETLGCPIISAAGPYDTHLVKRPVDLPGFKQIDVLGVIWDAPCLINLSHVKGHGDCAYAGACKNIAMGCVSQSTRLKLHSLEGRMDWIKERCDRCGLCIQACDTQAISFDKQTGDIRIFYHDCRFCRHCVNACPRQAIVLREGDGFASFQEAMATTTKTILNSFKPARVLHVNVLLNISMLCDCWGFSGPAVVPDIGIMASHDIVALETACLNAIHQQDFIPGSLIGQRQLGPGRHLFQQIHGKDPFMQLQALESHGLGQAQYELIEVP